MSKKKNTKKQNPDEQTVEQMHTVSSNEMTGAVPSDRSRSYSNCKDVQTGKNCK